MNPIEGQSALLIGCSDLDEVIADRARFDSALLDPGVVVPVGFVIEGV